MTVRLRRVPAPCFAILISAALSLPACAAHHETSDGQTTSGDAGQQMGHQMDHKMDHRGAAMGQGDPKQGMHASGHPEGMSMPPARGTLRKVDPESRKLTIKHGPIESMKMPPMTMVFTADEGLELDNLQVGDEIEFQVERRQGKMIVTEIRKP